MSDVVACDAQRGVAAAQSIRPRATYRLQLNKDFTFRSAREWVPYWAALGVSHLYLSPIFQARPGSSHGYDVTNHAALNPEIGSREDFDAFAATAQELGLGLILDIVPNHMAVIVDDNEWWLDVLENGPAARFAEYFDIDWEPTRASMRDRLLVPVLGKRFGDELRRGAIRIEFDRLQGAFNARYEEHRFPIDPQTYSQILSLSAPQGESKSADQLEFESLIDSFARLPERSDRKEESRIARYRDKEVLKRRLAQLCQSSSAVLERVSRALEILNAVEQSPSLQALTDLLSRQPYRLAYWRVAGDEINYRRFFDVDGLAALRVQHEDVFRATHGLVLDLVEKGKVEGLRVDHIDGLHDPKAYLSRLQTELASRSGRKPYVMVEKILAAHEHLRNDWPVAGTTGYEFGAAVVQWLMAPQGIQSLESTYRKYLRRRQRYSEVVRQSKKLVMRTSLAAEIAVLTNQLDRIAQSHPDTMDFTRFALRDALTDVIAAFPVYRTYVTQNEVSAEDRQSISWAVGAARKRSRAADRTVYDFIGAVLLGDEPESGPRREVMRAFAMKFQQVTSPVMAKGVEDTAFYRYFRLIALNEVGADPSAEGLSNTALHKLNHERAGRWPQSLLATSTHDTKRGEDVRYRLTVLSELSEEWRIHVEKWRRFNRSRRRLQADGAILNRNDEFLVLQSLLGIWPLEDSQWDMISTRLKDYMLKAIRESKVVTSWVDVDPDYETAVSTFIDELFAGQRVVRVRREFEGLAERLAYFGLMNCLSALVLKCMAPGIPDFYQGSELPELVLVDPDNRRRVDFVTRNAKLRELKGGQNDSKRTAERLLQEWRPGHLKLWLIERLLRLRERFPDLFELGDYEALTVEGDRADHVFAFARRCGETTLVSVMSRWTATLMGGSIAAPVGAVWANARVVLPERIQRSELTDQLTGRNVVVRSSNGRSALPVGEVFATLPVSVLC